MTSREAAIVTCYTDKLIGDIGNVYKYLEEISGEKVWTHEIPLYLSKYKAKIKQDYISIKVTDEEEW